MNYSRDSAGDVKSQTSTSSATAPKIFTPSVEEAEKASAHGLWDFARGRRDRPTTLASLAKATPCWLSLALYLPDPTFGWPEFNGWFEVDCPSDAASREMMRRALTETENEVRRLYRGALRSEDFARADFRREWAVRRVLVEGQPLVIGGPKKCHKTGILMDLAVSLGSGTPFLDQFEVPKKRRIAMYSCESGGAALQETLLGLCRNRRISPADVDAIFGLEFGGLSQPEDRAEMLRFVRGEGVEILAIDPAYIAMCGVEMSSLNAVGAVLRGLTHDLAETGCSLILAHHCRKHDRNAGSEHAGPPGLEDLTGAGFAEWARSWILLSRRGPFDPAGDTQQLWASIGGSSRFASDWELDIRTGPLTGESSDWEWRPTLTPRGEAVSREIDQKAQAKEGEKTAAEWKAAEAIYWALDEEKNKAATVGRLTIVTRFSAQKVKRGLHLLCEEKRVREGSVEIPKGKGTTFVDGYRIRRPEDDAALADDGPDDGPDDL